MERREKALYFFKNKIRMLIDDVYTPVQDVSSDYYLSNISRLRGAVWYAYEMGDIDKAQQSIFIDQLNELSRVITA